MVQGDAAVGFLHIVDTLRSASLKIIFAELIGVRQNTGHHVLLHCLLVQQRGHPILQLSQLAVHIGFDGGREKESSVVGAEVVQIEVDGSFDEGGETAAPILPVAAFQHRFFLRRQVQGKFLFFHVIRFLSGA